jgi:hypothetical protein
MGLDWMECVVQWSSMCLACIDLWFILQHQKEKIANDTSVQDCK